MTPTSGSAPKEEEDDVPMSQSFPPQSQLPPPTQLERPADCVNRNSTPAFAIVCSIMDRLRNDKAGKRTETLSRLFNMWRAKVGNDLYPLIRLLLPDVGRVVLPGLTLQRDRERPVYNLKEAMLAKCYIEVLGLDRHSDAAQRLIKWKQPVEGQVRSDTFALVNPARGILSLETSHVFATMRSLLDQP